MALWKPFRGNRVDLGSVEKHDGYVYFCTDDGSLFFDYIDEDGNLQRKQISANEAEKLVGYDIATILNSSDVEIPTSKAIKTYVDDAVANVSVEVDTTLTQSGKAADAKAVGDALENISYNDLIDKPFGEVVEQLGDTLTWDGDLENFTGVKTEPVTVSETTSQYVRVSSSVPSISDIVSESYVIYVTVNGNGRQALFAKERKDGEISLETSGGSEIGVIVLEDNHTRGSFLFPEKGVYFNHHYDIETNYYEYTKRITVPGYNFVNTTTKKIDKKYFPVDSTFTEYGIPADAKSVGDALENKANKTDLNSLATKAELNNYATKGYVDNAVANVSVEVDATLTQQGKAADAKAVGAKIASSANAADFIVVYDGEIIDFDSFVASNGAKLYVEIIDDVQLNKMQVTSLTEVYVYVERATGFGYLNIGIGDIVPLSELASNYIGYVEDFGWVIDSSTVTSQSEDGIYTVPVFQPMADVDRLPTAVINTNITYRVAHEDGYDAKLYMWFDLNDTEPIDMLNTLQLEGLKAKTYVVDALPETLKLSIIDEQDISSSCLYIYIDNNTGIAYVDVGLGAMPFGETVLGFADIDKGWSDDIYVDKEIGVFTVKIPVYHYTYHNYKNGKWFSYVDEERLFDTVIYPAADIGDTVSYDGNLDNAIYVGGEDYGYAKLSLYVNKISNSVFTMTDLSNGWSGTSSYGTNFSSENEDCADIVEEDFGISIMSSAGPDFWVVSINEDNTDVVYEGFAITFETAGTYVVHSIITLADGEVYQDLYPTSFTINGYNFKGLNARAKQIKSELLPEIAASVEVDTTLTEAGKAADAKAVGDKFDALIGPYSEGLEYTLKDDGTYEVSGEGTCTDTNIIIPLVVDGRRVSSIGFCAFQGEVFKTSITMPTSIKSIDGYAFDYCSDLTSITIPLGVTNIGEHAFRCCTNLKSITIPASVTNIENGAFEDCSNVTIYCEAKSKPAGWHTNWNPNNRPVVWGFVPDFVGASNRTIDKISEIDTWYDAMRSVAVDDVGISWENDFNLATDDGLDVSGPIYHKIPIVAGNNITFEVATVEMAEEEVVKINTTAQTPITHSELVTLRDNSELVPGMFYRITDYVCTTAQADTRAMDNKFDIIVQALSANTLSENASADYHYDEDGNVDGYFQTSGGKQTLNIEWVMSLGADGYENHGNLIFVELGSEENNEGITVPVLYKELTNEETGETSVDYEDRLFYVGTYEFNGEMCDRWRFIETGTAEEGCHTWDSEDKKFVLTNTVVENNEFIITDASEVEAMYTMYDDDEGSYSGNNKGDTFVEAGYKENSDGVVVPVLYKTNLDVFPETDYADAFYYVGQYTYQGTVYDRWRKIEEDGVSWDDSKRIYALTNIIVEDNQFMEGVVEEASREIIKVANLPAWELKYCLDNDTTRFAWASEGSIAGTWVFNDELITPEEMHSSSYDVYFLAYSWDGIKHTMNEFLISNSGDVSYYGDENAADDVYVGGWNDEKFKTITITEEPADQDFIAWLKANATKQSSNSDGKGVIYYMKDEHGNECPYDFKNIQFKRMLDEDGNLDLENGTDTWCYTFGGAQCDRSIAQDDMKEYNNNSIGSYYIGCDEYFQLPDNVFLGISECMTKGNKLSNNCTGNTFGSRCQSNAFGNDCSNNAFDNNFINNTFGDGCNSNTFGDGCNSNKFGNNCYSNTFGDGCGYNTFGHRCQSDTFGNECSDNVFGTDCGHNSFLSSCQSNIFGNNCGNNSFAFNCDNNTLGNDCNYNTFPFNCYYNAFGNNCDYIRINGSNILYIEVCSGIRGTSSNSLQLDPEPSVDYQQIYRKSGSKEILV